MLLSTQGLFRAAPTLQHRLTAFSCAALGPKTRLGCTSFCFLGKSSWNNTNSVSELLKKSCVSCFACFIMMPQVSCEPCGESLRQGLWDQVYLCSTRELRAYSDNGQEHIQSYPLLTNFPWIPVSFHQAKASSLQLFQWAEPDAISYPSKHSLKFLFTSGTEISSISWGMNYK